MPYSGVTILNEQYYYEGKINESIDKTKLVQY